jgi:hypothetical protein
MVEERGCLQNICEECGGKWNPLEKVACYLTCIFTYFLSFPFRIGWIIFGILIQFIVFLVVWLAFNLIPPILNQLINASLQWSPASVETLQEAWGVIKNFSLSLVLIFILVIGVATIFRLAEYEARKALVPLIIAALLISFSFAISTKIIDWANNITRAIRNSLAGPSGTSGEDFLMSKDIFNGLNLQLMNGTTLMVKNIFCLDGKLQAYYMPVKIQGTEPPQYKGPILPMMGLFLLYPVIVASIAGFILGSYIKFAMVFIMRTVFFVALVLVSPIAFLSAAISRRREVSHIFPGFLNWGEWWNALLQWSFCGIALVIWLAVAGMILKWGNNLFNITPTDFDKIGKEIAGIYATSTNPTQVQNQIEEPLQDLIRAFLPILGAGAAIFFGARSAPTMGQEFAKAALGLASGIVTAITTGAMVGIGAAVGGAAGVIGGAVKAAQGLGKIEAAAKSLPAALRVFGKEAFVTTPKEMLRRVPWAPLPKEMIEEAKAAWKRRTVEAEAAWKRRTVREEAEKAINKIYAEQGPAGVEGVIRSSTATPIEKSVAVAKLLEKGELSDSLIQSREFQDFLTTTEGGKFVKDLLKVRPDLAPNFTNPATGNPWTLDEIMREIPPSDVVRIHPKALTFDIIRAMSPAQRATLYRRGTEQQREVLRKHYISSLQTLAPTLTIVDTTPEKLRFSVQQAREDINQVIQALRAQNLVDLAEILEEMTNAIFQRRL